MTTWKQCCEFRCTEQTQWCCPKCAEPWCEEHRIKCDFCDNMFCGNDCMMLCAGDHDDDDDISACDDCCIKCHCCNWPFCPDCAPSKCNYCKKIWCDDSWKHEDEHRVHYNLVYMALALRCNSSILEAIVRPMRRAFTLHGLRIAFKDVPTLYRALPLQ